MGYLAGLFISLGFMVGITVLVGVSKTYSTVLNSFSVFFANISGHLRFEL